MNTQVEELSSALENVLVRFRTERRRAVSVVGMALPLGMGDQVPTRLMVFPLGEPPSNDDRKWRFTKADLARAVEKFQARTEPMPILYDHGNDPSKGSKAAGWVDSVELAADGLYANCRWTDQARQEIRSGEWGYRSPGWDGEEDPLGFIYAGPLKELSLVNHPAIGGMVPVVASVNPEPKPLDPQPTPPEKKENNMANVEAAKKAAAGFTKADVLDAVKAAKPGSEVFGDDVLWTFIMGLDSADAPADPMMPDAAKLPEAPAVPAFAAAEDEAKTASATAQAAKEAAELKEAKEQLAAQEQRIKALEARELSGKIVNASAADRKPGPMSVPDAPSPGDHVGQAINAYAQNNAPTHQAAIAYRDKARANGQNVSYRDAVIAVTRRKTA